LRHSPCTLKKSGKAREARTNGPMYLSLLEGMPQGVFCKDIEGRHTFANRHFCTLLGKQLEEILGKTDFELHVFTLAQQYREDDLKVLQSGKVLDAIEEHQPDEGEKRYVHVTKTPRFDSLGTIVGIQGTVEDVTERLKTEQALAYERDLLRKLLDNCPDRIYFKDLQSRFLKCSKAVAIGLGITSPEQAVGKNDFDFFTEEHARPAFEDEQRIIRTGEPIIGLVEKETWLDGHTTWAMTTKMPLRDTNGSIVGTFGISKDITDLMEVEAKLSYERDLLRALLDNIPDRISFKDRESRFLRCSRALVKRLGLENAEQMVGKTDFDFHPKEKAQEYFDDEQRIINTRQPLVNKMERQVDLNGQEIWASVSKVPIYTKDGSVAGIIALSRDITLLKKAQEQLQLARDAALESARLKSEFLANMSHEIRTPMNAIVGMTGILLETDLTEEQRDYTETIRISTETLLDIINDILDFSKIEAGKLVFDIIDFNVPDIVEGTVELLAARAQDKSLELLYWIHPDVPDLLRGDPGRIRQVLSNLLSNAVKFTEQGEVVLRVVKESEDDQRLVLRFVVSDTGIGISQHAQPLMFQAFTQADGSMTRKFGGTGLGLAISKQLVDLMHGKIGVESTLGKGSTFWFTVELQKPAAAGLPSMQEIEKGSLMGLRVLIVDDNATNRQILQHQVTSWRMRGDLSAGGLDALGMMRRAAVEGDPYQLVILDQQMPEMDGLTLAREIKADSKLAPTHLVMLTSMAQRLGVDELQAAGIAACLVKPVKKSRLFDCLSTLMAGPEGELVEEMQVMPATTHPRLILPEGRKNIRILLAEDNPVNQKVALRQLQKLGLSADAVANGLEVLDSIKRIPYDLIIMDCQMPEMDGYEATRQLRELEKDAGQKHDYRRHYVVAMTANAMQGDREKCLASGMDDYISKPVTLGDLQSALQRAIFQLHPPAECEPAISASE
jgi:two-component system sensor histidine kinase/response regulator